MSDLLISNLIGLFQRKKEIGFFRHRRFLLKVDWETEVCIYFIEILMAFAASCKKRQNDFLEIECYDQ